MPAATCPPPVMPNDDILPPVSMWQALIERAHELEMWIEDRPASPAQRDAWIEELIEIDADLCGAGLY